MLLLRGRSRITREAGIVRQTSDAAPGMLWLTPAGSREELIEISSPLPRFSSQSNFTKAFVRLLGISPGRYRRACASPVFAA